MHTLPKYALLLSFLGVILRTMVLGQDQSAESKEAAYSRVVTERAAKIVATLGVTDPQKAGRVQQEIARQYRSLHDIHDGRKAALNNVAQTTAKDAQEAEKSKIDAAAAGKLQQLHAEYLAALAKDLDSQQIEKVKDGMTYGVLPTTYKGYQAMLPDLTSEQKTQILSWLTEARERAMDEGSSEKKHAMFGKYKGRINNYLSAAGIDMKKASKDWEERIARDAEKAKK